MTYQTKRVETMWLKLVKNIRGSIKNQLTHFDSTSNVNKNDKRTMLICWIITELLHLRVRKMC